jgi:hypothetical protein
MRIILFVLEPYSVDQEKLIPFSSKLMSIIVLVKSKVKIKSYTGLI